MPDYNLSNLSPRSFEQLIQSLALKILLPGVVIFGDGPDGAREATYRGRLQYPSETEPWDGYLVVQAKFKQKPEGSGKDGQWLIGQLAADLKKFKDKKRQLVRPEYYLLCTNVVLSSAARKGAKDAAFQLLAKSASVAGLRGFDIWDYDKIRSFLDDAIDIRTGYAAWITSGDVLSEAMASPRCRPNFAETMTAFLQKEVLADQFVNLKQAGHVSDREAQIGQVFVDLPFSQKPDGDAPVEAAIEPGGFARELLKVGENKLDDLGVGVASSLDRAAGRHRPVLRIGPRPDKQPSLQGGRVVLIGGPGQGKSTMGQYVCQLYRAALLNPQKKTAREVKDAIASIVQGCEKDRVELPKARRFPIRLVLNDFASWLNQTGTGSSLLSYIAHRIELRTNRPVTVDDLKTWFSRYAWLLILDGLDEVPASSNRDAVLAAIQELWVDVMDGDVLVVATTRPQGYNDDFSTRYYDHYYLLPLSVGRAIHYAERLTAVRYGHDQDRQKRVLSHMRKAAETEATARLMSSPLQVTIMATLVDQSGPPPENRWKLFSEYFSVIYRREVERPIPANTILRQHQDLIKTIHDDVGLRLQIEAEQSGQTSARLSISEVQQLVVNRATARGFSRDDARELSKAIIETAANRLVFLVGVQQGRIGFEIRSLQEFFAAESVANGPDAQVQQRLACIAHLPYWRNVFLFAAGRCGAERRYLQPYISGLCGEMNSSVDPSLRVTRAGSLLALDLLEDLPRADSPGHADTLLNIAFDVTDRPKGTPVGKLAQMHAPHFDKAFEDKLQSSLASGDEGFHDGVWGLAIRLFSGRTQWIKPLVRKSWPETIELQAAILRNEQPEQDEWLASRLLELLPQVRRYELNLPDPDRACLVGASGDLANAIDAIFESEDDEEEMPIRSAHSYGAFHLTPWLMFDGEVIEACKLAVKSSFTAPFWQVSRTQARFCLDPSFKGFAELLTAIGDHWNSENCRIGLFPSWLQMACVQEADTVDEIRRLANLAAKGDLGDPELWMKLEKGWAANGIPLAAFSQGPFDDPPNSIRPVLGGWGLSADEEELTSLAKDCIDQFCLWPTQGSAEILVEILRAMGMNRHIYKKRIPAKPSAFRSLVPAKHHRSILDGLLAVDPKASDRAEWLSACETLGPTVKSTRCKGCPAELSRWIEAELSVNDQRSGLLPFLAAYMRHSKSLGSGLGRRWLTLEVDSRFSWALAIVQLGLADLKAHDAAQLAPRAVDAARHDPSVLDAIIKILADRHSGSEFLGAFALRAYEIAPSQDFRLREAIMKLLDDEVRRRVSGLADPAVQHNLGLFE
jgi:hypothetical protein